MPLFCVVLSVGVICWELLVAGVPPLHGDCVDVSVSGVWVSVSCAGAALAVDVRLLDGSGIVLWLYVGCGFWLYVGCGFQLYVGCGYWLDVGCGVNSEDAVNSEDGVNFEVNDGVNSEDGVNSCVGA